MSRAYSPHPEHLIVGSTKFEFTKNVNQFLNNDITFSFTSPGFSLVASMSGVIVVGKMELSTMKDLQQFAALMSEAWQARHSLKLTLASTISGH